MAATTGGTIGGAVTAEMRVWERAESSACAASILSVAGDVAVVCSSSPKYGPGTGSQARGEKIAAARSRPATNDDARIPPALFSDMPDRPPGLRQRSARNRFTRCEVHHSRERRRPSKRIDRYHPKNRFRRCGGKKQPRWPRKRGGRQGAGRIGNSLAGAAGLDGRGCLRCGLGWLRVPIQARSASEGRSPCRRAGG